MEVREALKTRLSIRRFADASFSENEMLILFKALQLSPSANNLQNWQFVFVEDPEIKRALVPACSNQKFVADCTYFITGVADPRLKWHMVDITIALTNLTLQAVELGYGTCWVGAFDETMVKQILKIPKDNKVVICMALGKPSGKHVPKKRKKVEDFIYLNRFGNRWSHKDSNLS